MRHVGMKYIRWMIEVVVLSQKWFKNRNGFTDDQLRILQGESVHREKHKVCILLPVYLEKSSSPPKQSEMSSKNVI